MSEPEHGDPAWLTEDQLNSWKAVVALTMTLPAALDDDDHLVGFGSCITTYCLSFL